MDTNSVRETSFIGSTSNEPALTTTQKGAVTGSKPASGIKPGGKVARTKKSI